MGILDQKHDNLVTLLDGISLLEELDQERIIKAVDTLDFAEKNVKEVIFSDNQLFRSEATMINNDDKI